MIRCLIEWTVDWMEKSCLAHAHWHRNSQTKTKSGSVICLAQYISHENLSSGFPTRSDTNRAVQPQKMARGLKFRIYIEEGLHYPCSENKGADQLRSHCAVDLLLCFRICKKSRFLMTRLILSRQQKTKVLVRLHGSAADLRLCLRIYAKSRVSRDATHLKDDPV